MNYSRRLPRVAPNERVTVRLMLEQRDFFLGSGDLPKDLGHQLHRAPVKGGKLTLRLGRESIDSLIAVAASIPAPDRKAERSVATLLRYLESLEDQFDDREEAEEVGA